MLKQILSFAVCLAVFTPVSQTWALYSEMNTNVKINTEVNEDIYIMSEDLDITSNVNWDAFIITGNARIDNDISEDLFLIWGDVRLLWSIWDDAKIVAWEVVIEKDVAWDLMIAAGDVYIRENVTIWGDLIIAAWKLSLDWIVEWKLNADLWDFDFNGTVKWDSDIQFNTFTNISWEGSFDGNILYKSQAENKEFEKLWKGEISFKTVQSFEEIKDEAKWTLGLYTIFKIIAIFAFSTFLFFFIEKVFIRSAELLKERTWKSFLFGLGTIFLFPMIILLLMISLIGLPIAFIFLFGYIYLLLFLPILNTAILTALIWNHCKNKFNIWFKLLTLLIFSTLFAVINGLSLVVGFFTLWALILLKAEILELIRNTDFNKTK